MPPRGRGLAHPAPTRTFCGPAQLSSSNNKMLLCQASELRQLPARSKSQPELGTVSTAAPVRQPRGAGAGPVPCVPRGGTTSGRRVKPSREIPCAGKWGPRAQGKGRVELSCWRLEEQVGRCSRAPTHPCTGVIRAAPVPGAVYKEAERAGDGPEAAELGSRGEGRHRAALGQVKQRLEGHRDLPKSHVPSSKQGPRSKAHRQRVPADSSLLWRPVCWWDELFSPRGKEQLANGTNERGARPYRSVQGANG